MADKCGTGLDTPPAPRPQGSSPTPRPAGTTPSRRRWTIPPVRLIGDELPVPCLDCEQRACRNLDAGASTGALAERVREDRRHLPGAVRASAGISTTAEDIERFLGAVAAIAAGDPSPVACRQDPHTGDNRPQVDNTLGRRAA
jgi:hypothetical protein